MKDFKFFTSPLLKSHEGEFIYPNEWFYVVHKEGKVITTPTRGLVEVEPYTMSLQRIMSNGIHLFTPDESVWYFKNLSIAARYVKMWKDEDKKTYARLKLYE